MLDKRLSKILKCFLSLEGLEVLEVNGLVDLEGMDDLSYDLLISLNMGHVDPDIIYNMHRVSRNQVFIIESHKSRISYEWLDELPYRHFILHPDELLVFNGPDIFQIPRCHLEDTCLNPLTVYRGSNKQLAREVMARRVEW